MSVSQRYPETANNASPSGELPPVSPQLPPFPPELQTLEQWVIFRLETRDGKATKVPYNTHTGSMASVRNPTTWSTFAEARATCDRLGAGGIGFVFSDFDPYFGIDLDKCHDPETGIIEPWAQEIIDRFLPYAYIEISISGTGVHIIGRGALPPGGNRKGLIETYDHNRFFTMSGNVLHGRDDLIDCQATLNTWHAEVFPAKAPHTPRPQPTVEHRPGDDALIEKASRATNGAKFAALMAGDTSGHGGDDSAADLALVSMLAFWTQGEPDQLDRLFRRSGLYREKWERDDYRERTIRLALENVTAYDPEYHRGVWHAPADATAPHSATDDDIAAMPCDALRDALRVARETIQRRDAVIARERELRKAAEDLQRRNSEAISKSLHMLKNPDLPLGEKVTALAITLDLRARVANGEQPAEHGFLMPAVAIAEVTGQSEATVAKHMRSLDKKGVITKRLVREAVTRDSVNLETGEIAGVPGTRDRNFIDLAGNTLDNVIDLTERIASYQRGADDRQHGGTRKAACVDHPDAGTVKHWHLECAECHAILDHGSAVIAPEETAESSGIKMTPAPSVSIQSYRGSNLIPESSPFQPITPTSTIKMTPDPTTPPPLPGYLPGLGEVAGNDRWTA